MFLRAVYVTGMTNGCLHWVALIYQWNGAKLSLFDIDFQGDANV
jgi:hypothetical protein